MRKVVIYAQKCKATINKRQKHHTKREKEKSKKAIQEFQMFPGDNEDVLNVRDLAPSDVNLFSFSFLLPCMCCWRCCVRTVVRSVYRDTISLNWQQVKHSWCFLLLLSSFFVFFFVWFFMVFFFYFQLVRYSFFWMVWLLDLLTLYSFSLKSLNGNGSRYRKRRAVLPLCLFSCFIFLYFREV